MHYVHFHFEDLVLRETILGDLDEVSDHGRVELVDLAGDEHGGDAEELELKDLDRLQLQEPVDDAQRRLERLRRQLELNLDD